MRQIKVASIRPISGEIARARLALSSLFKPAGFRSKTGHDAI
jgi:hypothetical protein